MRPSLFLVAVAVATLALVACSKPDSSAAPAASGSTSVPPSPAPSASPTTTDGVTLKEGDPAPAVDLPLQDGTHVKATDFKGKSVIVYFYPKDQTTGCTIEADNFRDKFADLQKAGITVIGVSGQDADSHKAFIDKEKLPFSLAVDTDNSIAKAFGVPTKGEFHSRQTFLIGKDGNVKKIWRDVTPKEHAVEVLAAAS